jgi:hypothetical protein
MGRSNHRLKRLQKRREQALGLIKRHEQAITDLRDALVLADLLEQKAQWLLERDVYLFEQAVLDGTWQQR